jgi:hypothetical protein
MLMMWLHRRLNQGEMKRLIAVFASISLIALIGGLLLMVG